MRGEEKGFFFTNLVDFDMIYGHRNDAPGYATALKVVDDAIPDMLAAMKQDDALFFTADHGVDPCFPGTDHTREHVPLLAWGPSMRRGVNLGIRNGFMDLGQTIADRFGVAASFGQSMETQLWE
jgi:phosphopentomutase